MIEFYSFGKVKFGFHSEEEVEKCFLKYCYYFFYFHMHSICPRIASGNSSKLCVACQQTHRRLWVAYNQEFRNLRRGRKSILFDLLD